MGPQGPPGDTGPLAGYEKVASAPTTVSSSSPIVTISAICSSTKRVVGGGYLGNMNSGNSNSVLVVISSGPNATNTGWQVSARRIDNGSYTVTAYALCADVNPSQE